VAPAPTCKTLPAKFGEGQIDPSLPVTTARFRHSNLIGRLPDSFKSRLHRAP